MTYRQFLKWLHWLSAGLILYFFLVEPEESRVDPGGALSTHAGMGVLLAIVVVIWTVIYMRKGLAGRPGPKLPALAKKAHPLMHKVLHIAMPVMLGTGLLVGLLAPYAIKGFGVIPLGGIGTKGLHSIAEEVHEIAFNVLIAIVVVHVVFSLWRHFYLKDNALRIMTPKILHRWL